MVPTDPFNPNRAQSNVRTSTVNVDALIRSATETAARFQWATWAPDPRDQIIVSAIQPPLTFSMVLQHANLRAWLDGRVQTQPHVDAVTNELAAAWWSARMTGIYTGVADVLRDLFLWNAVVRMPEREREEVRIDLVRRRETAFAPSPQWPFTPAPTPPAAKPASDTTAAPSPPPVTKTPRMSDARKDWAREHSPAYTTMIENVMLRMGSGI
jgi:hypothetical protein